MNQQNDPPIPQRPPSFDPPSATEGRLIVHVTTARGAIPIEGALVSVSNYAPEFTEGRGDVIFTAVSGRDGNTEPATLPAPSIEGSLSPGTKQPFSLYNLDVQLEGYRGQSYIALPIFGGITAIQPVDMIPLSENGRLDVRRPEEDRFYETEPQNL